MAYTYISPTPAALPLLYTKGSPPLRRTSPPSHLPGAYIAARQLPPIAKMVFLPLLQTLLEPHRCSPVGSVAAGHSTDTTQLSPMGAITGKDRRIPHHSSWMIFLALITPARLPGRNGFLLPDLDCTKKEPFYSNQRLGVLMHPYHVCYPKYILTRFVQPRWGAV